MSDRRLSNETSLKPSPSCASCRFVDTTVEPALCRRHAPTPYGPAGSNYEHQWPMIVLDTDWCGEYDKATEL